ncbi:MAG: FCD domain-containing protein [Planctomycetes bacterium]|nr:FCD domain-containing protein [Planctomycetota bacterium]
MRTLAGRVHHELRKRILGGVIAPGTRLIVDKLAAEFDVSITPVREAMRLLERDGLIAFRPHCGATTTLPSAEHFADLNAVRSALEPVATRAACARLSQPDFVRLDQTLAVGYACIASDADVDAWLDADQRFHALLVHRSGNALLEEILGQLYDRIRLHREMYFISPQRLAQSVHEHAVIIEALRARDADKAGDLMSQHMHSHVPLQS